MAAMTIPVGTRDFSPGGDFLNGLDKLRQVLEDTPAAAEAAAVQALNKRWRKLYMRTIAGVVAVMLLFGFGLWIVLDRVGAIGLKLTDQDAAIARSVSSISSFEDQLKVANAKLVAQGLPPVQGPVNAQPGTPQQAELSTAAATASTLASLPKEVLVKPNAADLAQAVASYIQVNPIVVSPEQIIAGVAAYFQANPIKNGVDGKTGEQGIQGVPGERGSPPTAEEIRQAFRDEVQANPQLLCPQGGTYSSRNVLTQSGGVNHSTPQFGCFGDDGEVAAPPPDPVLPIVPSGTNSGGGAAATSPPASTGGTAPAPQGSQEPPVTPVQPDPAPVTPEAPTAVPAPPAPLIPGLPALSEILG
jgi:hypothetical protein